MVVLAYKMLHTKFQGHRYIGSGEDFYTEFQGHRILVLEKIFKVFTISGHVTQTIRTIFFPKGPAGCILNLVKIGPVVLQEKSFEIVDGRTDDGACLYYKLPRSLRLSRAKNKNR